MGSNGSNGHSKSLVFVQLTGGNDALNTVVPINDEHYHNFRPTVQFQFDELLDLDGNIGLNPNMTAIKRLWDEGKVAIINGIGYPNPNRSHFRSMDIWHTAEPTKVATEGWLGQLTRDLDPKGENVLTAVNFGRGLPRALSAQGVPVASVGDLATYGLYPDIRDEAIRNQTLDMFSQMYGGSGKDAVKEFIQQTGRGVMQGADILGTAPRNYSSSIEYADTSIAQSLKDAAQVMFADIGTRIFYTGRAATTRMRARCRCTRSSSARCPTRSATSGTMWKSTAMRTTRRSSSSPSSGGASRTTAPAPTTAPAALRSSSAAA